VIRLQEKEQLLKDLVALRRIETASSQGDEVAEVGASLARLIGPTVSRAMAARAVGVSQTALDRRLRSAEVPSVITPEGRREVPVTALVDLIVDVEQRRRDVPEDPYPLASVLRERRMEGEALEVDELLPSRYRRELEVSGHRRAELRTLAYHRAVARRLDDPLLQDARRRLQEWRAEGRIDEQYADRWEQVLARSLPAVQQFIRRDSEEARDLRQNSPFAGALSEAARRRVLDSVG
jgi:hypothetical protein